MLQTLSLKHTKLAVVSWFVCFFRLYSWLPRPRYCTQVLETWHGSPLGWPHFFLKDDLERSRSQGSN